MSKAPVQSVRTSLRILGVLQEQGPCTITALADRLDRPKATVYYHLQTLSADGFVASTPDGYDLGLRLLELGGHARDRHGFPAVVGPNLKRLSRETNETAVFAVLDAEESVLLNLERPTGLETTVDVTVGERFPLHCSAVGKALLSGLPEPRLDETFERLDLESFTAETLDSESAVRDELATVRSDGHAVDRGEYDPDVHGVATPVVDGAGELLGAIGVLGPASRLYSDRFTHELPHLVERFGERIEYDLAD